MKGGTNARGRNRLVDLLNGDRSSAGIRRNRKDDFHLELLLRSGMYLASNYLDAGANQGQFLKGIQRLAPRGHPIAYEPLPILYAKLVRNFPEMEVRQRALSEGNASSVGFEVPYAAVIAA